MNIYNFLFKIQDFEIPQNILDICGSQMFYEKFSQDYVANFCMHDREEGVEDGDEEEENVGSKQIFTISYDTWKKYYAARFFKEFLHNYIIQHNENMFYYIIKEDFSNIEDIFSFLSSNDLNDIDYDKNELYKPIIKIMYYDNTVNNIKLSQLPKLIKDVENIIYEGYKNNGKLFYELVAKSHCPQERISFNFLTKYDDIAKIYFVPNQYAINYKNILLKCLELYSDNYTIYEKEKDITYHDVSSSLKIPFACDTFVFIVLPKPNRNKIFKELKILFKIIESYLNVYNKDNQGEIDIDVLWNNGLKELVREYNNMEKGRINFV